MAHPNAELIERFYQAFQRLDGEAMAACYAPQATFHAPAFGELRGREVGDMWRLLTVAPRACCGAGRRRCSGRSAGRRARAWPPTRLPIRRPAEAVGGRSADNLLSSPRTTRRTPR